jgi:hypothetical protein
VGRPALAGLAMGAITWLTAIYSRWLALLVGPAVYVAALVFLRVLTPEEREMLASLLPAPLRRLMPVRDVSA